jgi:hypothetical protein
MQGKITLITPPDIYENNNFSLMFFHLTDAEQDILTQYLSNLQFDKNINIYLYNGEPNISWVLYAQSRCEHKYINIDNANYITQCLSGYILANSGTCYSTASDDLTDVYSHINLGKVNSVENFLEGIFGEQQQKQ